MIENISQALSFIHSCNKFGGKKDDLTRMTHLMQTLGSPERLYPIVHIAGTNGKGSTAAICASILQSAGYRTGLFTSPFLIRFNERIRLNGEQIDDDTLVSLCEKVRIACETVQADGFSHPLEFEVVTAIGYLYFAQRKVDVAVIEVGLGGRLDSTNIAVPCVSVITPIGFDHIKILGDSITSIAGEKAGIIKENRPVVCAAQTYPEAERVIRETAQEKNAPFVLTSAACGTFSREGLTLEDGMTLHMAGTHQAVNLGCALGVVQVLRTQGFSIDESAVMRGVENARWDGRCQWIGDLLIDGAHNGAGADALADYLARFVSDRPKTFVFAAMRDKDISYCVQRLAPFAARVITTDVMPERCAPCESLKKLFADCGVSDATAIPDPKDALALAQNLCTQEGGVVVCCGSLYLVGCILSLLT